MDLLNFNCNLFLLVDKKSNLDEKPSEKDEKPSEKDDKTTLTDDKEDKTGMPLDNTTLIIGAAVGSFVLLTSCVVCVMCMYKVSKG